MTRISSSFTFFFKRVFPVFWFGFLAVFLASYRITQDLIDRTARNAKRT